MLSVAKWLTDVHCVNLIWSDFTGASTALRICHQVVVTCDTCKL